MERNYDFRTQLLQVHCPDLRDWTYMPEPDMVELDEKYSVVISADSGEVLTTAAQDLQDFLLTSMGLSLPLRRLQKGETVPPYGIEVAECPEENWIHGKIPASYVLQIGPRGIRVCGIDQRGCAQGCYALEDRMTQIRAPFLKLGESCHSPAFSPRMVHSGYGQEQYPDAYLSAVAHAGMDAILLFVKDVDRTDVGYQDFNTLIRRAAKYGLDVYAYSRIESDMHPDEPGAQAYYETTYGRLFAQCGGFKGVVLVGESVEFPSKDPRVSPRRYYNNTVDGLPTGKPTPGWFPCRDYPQWLSLLQKVICGHKPDADIVLWTYNWGKQPEEDRLALIDALPSGITLMATFEMFNTRQVADITCTAVDYTLSFPEAGPYFLSEAKRAKERGIRLYTQANSAGRTWDFGVAPVEPFPLHWQRRYESMLKAREEYGLCGIMESHHYGFFPSFISRLEKRMFTLPLPTGTEAVREMTEEMFGPAHTEQALEAWSRLSFGMDHYPCTNEDQYGPFRIGPAYPLVLESDVKIPTVPYAIQGGNTITVTNYRSCTACRIGSLGVRKSGLRQVRLPGELRCLEVMAGAFAEGRRILEDIGHGLTGQRRRECDRLCNLIDFLEHCVLTTAHAKQWLRCSKQLEVLTETAALEAAVAELEEIARNEIRNAEETIPLVRADSRLGWEPSMEYMADEAHLRWKIRQVTQVLENELPMYLRVIRGEG